MSEYSNFTASRGDDLSHVTNRSIGSTTLFTQTGLILIFLLLLGGCAKEPQPVEVEVTPVVDVMKVQPQTIYPSLEFTGSVISQEVARIHPEVGGTVDQVNVRVGNRVQKGQVLVELDPSDFELRLQIARAERLKASAEYRRMIRGYRPEDIEATRNVYENTRAIFRSKNRNLERNRALFDSGTMTERDWTVFLEDLAAASAMVGKVSAELSKMEEGYESYDIQSASASLMLAHANEALAERNLKHTRIVSPIDGVVSMRDVEIGQLVDPNRTVVEVQDPSRVWLLADASAKEAGLIEVGQEAELYSDTLDNTQRGRVDRIAQTLDPNTKSLAIWFAWNSTENLPPIGSFAKGTLFLDPVPNVVSVHRKWLHLERGIHFVWAVEEGILVRKNVKIGKDRGEEVVIDSGLETGTQLVVSPPTSFEEGLAVNIGNVRENGKGEPSDQTVISLSMSPGNEGGAH
ncbi:MAG: efflux RND transporter periplasmic adaptor subunit [Candidatus Omnitrophica bacterium]|nr:efflux RND transporter periplasmic adaptor subunit [Candidatus Omnitrophota bacterium]